MGGLFLFGACALLPMCDSDTPPTKLAAKCLLNSDCNNPLSCTFGKCHAACKATRDCQKGERCVQVADGNVCQFVDEQNCTYDSDCDAPLKCAVDSICRNACKEDADCLPAQSCVDGSCAESSDIGTDGHLKGSKGGTGGTGGTGGKTGSGGGGGDTGTGGAGGASSGGTGSGTGGKPDTGVSRDAGSTDASVTPDGSSIDAAADHHTTAPWHLWIMENTSGHLFGYSPDQLAATYGDEPDVNVTLSDNVGSIHFDKDGNLWGLTGGTIVKFAAKDVQRTGTATAVGKFTENSVTGNVANIALDPDGNLWTAGFNAHGFYRYNKAVIDAQGLPSAALTPSFKLTTSGPGDICFDPAGNLYVQVGAGSGTANEAKFAASQLVGNGNVSDGPVVTLNPRLPFYSAMLIGPAGELIVATETIYRFPASSLVGPGTVNATPDTFTATGGLGHWGTYDPNGNLWISADKDKFTVITTTDLAKTGTVTVTPTITIRSPTTVIGAKFGSLTVR